MARRLVTVSDTAQLPPEILAKIGETYISRVEAGTIIDNRVQFAIDNLASETPVAHKIPRFDENGMLTVNDGTEPEHPVSLGQLDERIPADGIPLATQLQDGLMSISDKTKLDSTMPRKPFPWGVKLSTLETGVVYYFNESSYPEGTDFTELPEIIRLYATNFNISLAFEIVVSGYTLGTVKGRSYSLKLPIVGGDYIATTEYVLIEDPYPDMSSTSWTKTNLTQVHAALLDNATASNVANTLVKRDSSGRFTVPAPILASHAVPKSYVNDAGNLTTGKVAPARIDNATSLIDGLMPKADKVKLDAATDSSTAWALARRNGQGTFSVTNPTNSQHVANKEYVDSVVGAYTSANTLSLNNNFTNTSEALRYGIMRNTMHLVGVINTVTVGIPVTNMLSGSSSTPTAFRPASGTRTYFTITRVRGTTATPVSAYILDTGIICLAEAPQVGDVYHFNAVISRVVL